ncbi:MAG: PAS domain S-box protein [Desulfobulbaceae bacterium]|nr:PAS domain S-box protein [Desulfobulbaceae bacterium]
MTTRFSVLLPHFVVGALVLCCACFVQSLLFQLPVAPALYFMLFCIGGLAGLLIGDRTTRIKSLRQANEQLQMQRKESEEAYHRLFTVNPAMQLLIDPKTGRIVKTNPASQLFYGYDAETFTQKTIFEINTAEPETTSAMLQRALAQEQRRFYFQHRLQSGEIRAVEVYTVPVFLQGQTLMHSVVFDVTASNNAEEKLLRKTLEQRLLLDSIPVNIWYLHDPETFGTVNKAFADNIGLSPKEIAHKKLATVFNQEMLTLALAGNRQVFTEKKALTSERWIHFGTHQPRYMAITKTPKIDEAGQVEFVVCTATDITKVQQARELLQVERDLHIALGKATSQKETLRICLEKAIEVSQTDGGGLYLVDETDGSLTLTAHKGLSDVFVENASRYSGDSAQVQMVRHNQPVYARYADFALQVHNETLQGEGLLALGMVPISFQGKVIACLNVASRKFEEIPRFNRAALEGMAIHIGTFLVHKNQEQLIRQHQQNLETLFNSMQDLVFILDLNGTILDLNATAASRLGYRREALLGKNVLAVHPEEYKQEVLEIFAAILAEKSDHCPLPLLTQTGEMIPVETHITRGQWSGRQVLFGLSRDISSRLQIERQQRLLLKNEGLERMAAAMAHHFNNLMAIVAGNLELAEDDVEADSETHKRLTQAMSGCKRAAELGHALLIYTGQFADVLTPLNLSDCCQELLASGRIELAEHITLTVDLASPGPVVIANKPHLEQVLTSLLTNALETIDKAPGHIALRVTSVDRAAIRNPHIFPTGWTPTAPRYGCLEITDSGAGIDEAQMINIFDLFYSDKFLGRGLGLPLALSIVKKFNGAITVTSQVNQGTAFQVLLPEHVVAEQPVKNHPAG